MTRERAYNKLIKTMDEQQVSKLRIKREYLPEIFESTLLELYEGLPIIKPSFELYLRSRGIDTKISSKEIQFKNVKLEESSVWDHKDISNRLINQIPDVWAEVASSIEEVPNELVFSANIDENHKKTIAALYTLAKTALKEMKTGGFELLFVKGSDGYTFLIRVGPDGKVTVGIGSGARSGLISLELNRINK